MRGVRGRLRLHPARRHLVDQQHRFPDRAAGRHQHRRVRHAAPDPGVPGQRSPRSPRPRCATLVNTHHHGDHTSATTCSRRPTIIAHEGRAPRRIAFGPAAGRCRSGRPRLGRPDACDPPFVTFADQVTVTSATCASRSATWARPAHTTNDSIVWLPERSVLFCGDLIFNGGTPFLLMGSVAGALEVLENVVRAARRADHRARARPGLRAGARSTPLDYLRFVTDVAARGRPAGLIARWRPPGKPASAGSPPGPTPSGSSATCTAPTPNSAARRTGAPSTSSPPSATWSPTTAGAR